MDAPSCGISRRPPMSAAFIVSLVLKLREQGVQVSAADAYAAAVLLRSSESWTREELLSVVASVLVKRAMDRPTFEAVFAACYDPPASDAPTPTPISEPASTTEDKDREPRQLKIQKVLEPLS